MIEMFVYLHTQLIAKVSQRYIFFVFVFGEDGVSLDDAYVSLIQKESNAHLDYVQDMFF